MAKQSRHDPDLYDELDYIPDLDPDFLDDMAIDGSYNSGGSMAAWQRIEMRKESDWLRSQVVDWDDWDEYFESH